MVRFDGPCWHVRHVRDPPPGGHEEGLAHPSSPAPSTFRLKRGGPGGRQLPQTTSTTATGGGGGGSSGDGDDVDDGEDHRSKRTVRAGTLELWKRAGTVIF